LIDLKVNLVKNSELVFCITFAKNAEAAKNAKYLFAQNYSITFFGECCEK